MRKRKKITLQDLAGLIEGRGGKLISEEYVNSRTPLMIVCESGHEFSLDWSNLQAGKWCRKCYLTGLKKDALPRLKNIANDHSGVLVSTQYVDNKTKLSWRCKFGHSFMMEPRNVTSGHWCQKCAKLQKSTRDLDGEFEELYLELAKKQKGKVTLSDLKPGQGVRWECVKGHSWYSYYKRALEKWCNKCLKESIQSARIKKYKDEIVSVVKRQNGKFVGYAGQLTRNSKLHVQCKKHGPFSTRLSYLKSGQWCPQCGIEKSKIRVTNITQNDLDDLAKRRGGKCLDDFSQNLGGISRVKIHWQCSEGHQWKALWGNVSSGKWCPHCAGSYGERVVRIMMEAIFNHKFYKCRPNFLLNPATKKNLEIDGYSFVLQIGFEHQGRQHGGKWSKGKKSFFPESRYDSLKRRLAKIAGVKLFYFPEIDYNFSIDKIKELIRQQAQRYKIRKSLMNFDVNPDLEAAFVSDGLEKCRDLAAGKGGELVSKKFKGSQGLLKFKCSNGHVFQLTPNNLFSKGQWCSMCNSTHLRRYIRIQFLNNRYYSNKYWVRYQSAGRSKSRTFDVISDLYSFLINLCNSNSDFLIHLNNRCKEQMLSVGGGWYVSRIENLNNSTKFQKPKMLLKDMSK